MKKLLALLGVIMALAGAGGATAAESGTDGTLVAGIGVITPQDFNGTFWLTYKPRGEKTSWLLPDATISYATGLFGNKADFQGKEVGRVLVKHLKPGDYEIFGFQISVGALFLTPKKEVSLPFTIKPGESTYIGDFAAVGEFSLGTLNDGYFVLTDQQERDLAIARTKEPQLAPVTVAVADASKLDIRWIKPAQVACAADETLGRLINAAIKAEAQKKAIAAGQDPATIPEPKPFSMCAKN